MKNVFGFIFLIKKVLLVCSFVLSLMYCSAQHEFTKGNIIDSVAIDKNDSFALYLPTSYNQNKPTPIIFVFEPAARGAIGVAPFLDVSENYGYIVVCSNNSKNGPMDKNFEIANRLFKHIFSDFSIDESEMYISGFSGGSRLATAIAVLTKRFSGVIACGAGFSPVPSHMPSTQGFAYAGICGNEDMNYREMLNNKRFLQKLNFDHTLFTYNGDHSWPPNEQINRAFRWLQGKRTKDTVLMSRSFEIDFNEAEAFHKSKEYLFSAEVYDRILDSYRGVIPLDNVSKKHKSLISSIEYKKEYKSLQNALNQESNISKRLFDTFYNDLLLPKKTNYNWWEKELNKLEKLNVNGSLQQKKMVSRIRFSLFATIYVMKNKNSNKYSPEQILFVNKIRKLIYHNQ